MQRSAVRITQSTPLITTLTQARANRYYSLRSDDMMLACSTLPDYNRIGATYKPRVSRRWACFVVGDTLLFLACHVVRLGKGYIIGMVMKTLPLTGSWSNYIVMQVSRHLVKTPGMYWPSPAIVVSLTLIR